MRVYSRRTAADDLVPSATFLGKAKAAKRPNRAERMFDWGGTFGVKNDLMHFDYRDGTVELKAPSKDWAA